jgi:hypothetical protein
MAHALLPPAIGQAKGGALGSFQKVIVGPATSVSVPGTPVPLTYMKHLRLVLTLSLVALIATFSIARADSYDSDDATIKKATDKTVTVTIDKKDYTLPITFGDGASWDNVMDHYELSDASVACIKSGKASLLIGSDGSASWKK